MPQPSLAKPVGQLMRPIPRVWPTSTVLTAAAEIRDSGLPAVGVTDGATYIGIVTQASLTEALARGVSENDTVEKALDYQGIKLPPYAAGEEALTAFTELNISAIPIVDDSNQLMGVLTPADLWPKKDRPPAPERIGGMATPFGVYLTTGVLRAGADGFALVATGMMMFTVLFGVQIATEFLAGFSERHDIFVPDFLYAVFFGGLFATIFRFLPISSIHAAEHKVVHAIERGEELTRENVRRMPRVHPRCGTNFATGGMIFSGVAGLSQLIPDQQFRMLAALLATLIFWRPVGSMVQYWVTTREPSDKHLDMGIRSGKQLLERYATGRTSKRTFGTWIFNSGLLHVMAGSFLMVGLFYLLSVLFHWPSPL